MCRFIDSVVKGTLHIARGEMGLTAMQLLDAIHESAEEGEPVEAGR